MKRTKRVLSCLLVMVLAVVISSSPVMAEEMYMVKSGDVLWKIAEEHNTTWQELVTLNDLSDPNMILVGQSLKLSAPMVEEETPADENFVAESIMINSRGTDIPAVFTYPKEGSNFPLVVMAHGHGGSKDEAGGFVTLAQTYAENGIATIRMDFPGCGDSTESFYHNTITNMMLDIDASLEYALAKDFIDESQVGIFGYSMGGRLAMLSAARDSRYKALATWAPAATNGASSMYVFMGGQESFEAFNAEAQEEGMYLFTTIWGGEQLLSKQFFDDMMGTNPIDEVATFTGPVMIVNGDLDVIVDRPVIDAALEAFTSSSSVENHVVVGADHGYGIYSGQPELTMEAVDAVVDFMSEALQ